MLPFETDADRLALLQALGETVTLTGAVSGIPTAPGLWAYFEDGSKEIRLGDVEIAGRTPEALMRDIDIQGIAIGDTITTADGTVYTISWPPEPDGTGMTKLKLMRA